VKSALLLLTITNTIPQFAPSKKEETSTIVIISHYCYIPQFAASKTDASMKQDEQLHAVARLADAVAGVLQARFDTEIGNSSIN
jgi:hypothetical protein